MTPDLSHLEALAHRHAETFTRRDTWGSRVTTRRMSGTFIRRNRENTRHEVGYEWHRPNAHRFSGIVYTCILGVGRSHDDAMLRAATRVEKRIQKRNGPR